MAGGSVSWSISGKDTNNCDNTGSDSFNLTEANNPSQITLQENLLPGSQHFLRYDGTGEGDFPNPQVTWTMSCPDGTVQHPSEALGIYFMFNYETPVMADGSLQGDRTINQPDGSSVEWQWDLHPVQQ